MAYQGIGTGTTPNDNSGDSLLTGAIKINNNFQEIYTALGAVDGDILPARRYIITDSSPISSNYTSTSEDVNKVILVNLQNTEIQYELPSGADIQVGDWIKLVNVGLIDSSSLSIVPQGSDKICGYDFSIEEETTTFFPVFNNEMQEISFIWTGSDYGWRIMNGNLTGLFSLLVRPTPPDYNIEEMRSIRLDGSAYLLRVPESSGNRKTWTWSAWIKRSNVSSSQTILSCIGATNNSDTFTMSFTSNGTIVIKGFSTTWRETTAVLKDPSAWYHIVLSVDTTQTEPSNRIKLYINGSQITSFINSTDPISNQNLGWNQNIANYIGVDLSALIAHVHFIDGLSLDHTSFGEFDNNNIWNPIKYTGFYNYGVGAVNGFRLLFFDPSTSSSLGYDTSGVGNDWIVNEIFGQPQKDNDSFLDVPISTISSGIDGAVRGNYATLNPFDRNVSTTISNGNLDITPAGSTAIARATFGVSSGKWYWEVRSNDGGGAALGIAYPTQSVLGTQFLGSDSESWAYYYSGGDASGALLHNYSNNPSFNPNQPKLSKNDVIGIALDLDARTLSFWFEGVQSEGFTNLPSNIPYFPAITVFSGSFSFNFGQKPFEYLAPSALGYKALCSTNLPDSQTITTVGQYAGNGANTNLQNIGVYPFIHLNGVPTEMTINNNNIVFGTDAYKLSNGFGIINPNYNGLNVAYNYAITATGDTFKNARGQINP